MHLWVGEWERVQRSYSEKPYSVMYPVKNGEDTELVPLLSEHCDILWPSHPFPRHIPSFSMH